jgi:hypothetical protein
MPPTHLALIFVPLAVLAVWSILRDLQTGVTRDLYRFSIDAKSLRPGAHASI